MLLAYVANFVVNSFMKVNLFFGFVDAVPFVSS